MSSTSLAIIFFHSPRFMYRLCIFLAVNLVPVDFIAGKRRELFRIQGTYKETRQLVRKCPLPLTQMNSYIFGNVFLSINCNQSFFSLRTGSGNFYTSNSWKTNVTFRLRTYLRKNVSDPKM